MSVSSSSYAHSLRLSSMGVSTGLYFTTCSSKYLAKNMKFVFFFILYYDQQMYNYFTNYHTPTRFGTIVSSSGSSLSLPGQVTQVFQMQLLVIQFTIKMFHIGFMQVLIL